VIFLCARTRLFRPGPHALTMAKALTGEFTITETVNLGALAPDGTISQATIDLGAYLNVPTGQALGISSVDWIFQVGSNYSSDVARMLDANGALGGQLTDLNPGSVFLRADDQSLVSSAGLNIDRNNNIATHTNDLFPDNFGSRNTMSDLFIIVNDQIYVTAGVFGANIDVASVLVTAKIRCRVIKLSSKDWVSRALQSVASDS